MIQYAVKGPKGFVYNTVRPLASEAKKRACEFRMKPWSYLRLRGYDVVKVEVIEAIK